MVAHAKNHKKTVRKKPHPRRGTRNAKLRPVAAFPASRAPLESDDSPKEVEEPSPEDLAREEAEAKAEAEKVAAAAATFSASALASASSRARSSGLGSSTSLGESSDSSGAREAGKAATGRSFALRVPRRGCGFFRTVFLWFFA